MFNRVLNTPLLSIYAHVKEDKKKTSNWEDNSSTQDIHVRENHLFSIAFSVNNNIKKGTGTEC